MRYALSVFALGILELGLAPRFATAATPSVAFGISAMVQASCRASLGATVFRTYAAAAANATSAVSVACSNSAPYNVALSAGTGSSVIAATPRMTGLGTGLLGYVLSSNLRGIVNRGQTLGADPAAGEGNGFAQMLFGHGQISAGQYLAGGAYADSITVAVTY
ncbi:MAG: spore coat protein U domain-containing protein [Terracidiphilus sp.]|nr:spore coat protein U domain-containing protein [Terracidiphilus sp.]